MARFKIISKDGGAIRFEGKPRYIGTYLKPSYLEFSEIASPAPIDWQVGDYVDYPRTGMRYRLFSIPQPSKNARKGTNGRSFTYSNVQLYSATKELEIALFRDIVDNDNNIHFSTSPDVVTFENVEGIARRIQACMNDLYPNRWEIRIASFDAVADAEVLEKIAEPKDFALSGGTCLDALSKIYELWEDIGWFHSYENGKDVITIGYANRRDAENISDAYLYGKGNGLTAIKKSQTNKDEFATRLYVYGSERNLPSRYYNGKDILNAESVDIRNLMLPLERWGKTNGKPDARLAYQENASAVEKFGVIPKVHYFDSVEAGADIYPSIEKMTIGQIRKALADLGKTEYYPSTSIYPNDAERVDEVRSAVNPSDKGYPAKGVGEGKYAYEHGLIIDRRNITANVPNVADANVPILNNYLYYDFEAKTGFSGGEVSIIPNNDIQIRIPDANFIDGSVTIYFDVYDTEYEAGVEPLKEAYAATQYNKDSGYWYAKIPRIKVEYDKRYEGTFPIYTYISIYAKRKSTANVGSVNVTIGKANYLIGINEVLEKTFHLTLKQIGFNINLQADRGEGKSISMKTGACAGRDFIISECFYYEEGDYWSIDLKRQQDDTLGLMFPNADYPISAGDDFVLLDIAMPELYVQTAMDRLATEGEKLLARASRIQSHYEPSIDAKVMIESGRTLREGMYMSVTDEDVIDNATDYIIIDTLSIYEDESAIPTYKVTLRERRKVTYKGTPSATTSNDTKSVSDGTDEEVDLTGYAKESWVEENIKAVDQKNSEQDEEIAGAKNTIEQHGNELTKINEILQYISVDEESQTLNIELNIATPKEISAGGAGSEMEGEGVGGSLESLSDVRIGTMPSDEYQRASQRIGYENGYWVNKTTMYGHNQNTASAVWSITHNLGKMPNVKVIDSTGALVYGAVVYDKDDLLNKLTITFGGSFAGTAYLD